MILVDRSPASHWYLSDGTPYHTVARADGKGDRPATLRDARKVGALPSVTNRLSILAKPGLEAWKIEQGILSALTLPRSPDEPLDAFARRVVEDSEGQVTKAADLGTAVHNAVEDYLTRKAVPQDPQILSLFEPVKAWLDTHIEAVATCEEVVVHGSVGYAGRVDLVARVKDVGLAVIDFKTQNIKTKPTYYETWPLQLEAYRQAILSRDDPFMRPTHIMSVVINSNTAGLHPYVWPVEEYPAHWEAFKHASHLWSYVKGYSPVLIQAQKAA
jgi:hypothetical protein